MIPQLALCALRHRGGGGGPVGVVQIKNFGFHTARPLDDTYVPDAPFTAGNKVIVAFSVYDVANIGSDVIVKINGTAASYVGGFFHDSYTHAIFIGTAGAGTEGVRITFDTGNPPYSGGAYIIAGAMERDDLAASPIDSTWSNSNGAPQTTYTVTTGALAGANELLIAVSGTGNSMVDNITVDAPDTVIYSDGDGNNDCPSTFAYRDASGTGAQTVTWTGDAASSWAMMVAAFKRD